MDCLSEYVDRLKTVFVYKESDNFGGLDTYI